MKNITIENSSINITHKLSSLWKNSSHTAIIAECTSITYQELFNRVSFITENLKRAGVCSGDIVVCLLPGSFEFVFIQLATTSLGCVFAPISLSSNLNELISYIERLSGAWLLCLKENHIQNSSIFDHTSYEESVSIGSLCTLYKRKKWVRKTPLELKEGGFIRYTSGTTAADKGVCISQKSAWHRVMQVAATDLIVQQDRVMCALPLPYHFVVSLLLFLYRGSTIIITSSQLPNKLKQILEAEKPDVFYGSPYHVKILSQGNSIPHTLKKVISTSQELPRSTGVIFYEKFGVPVIQALGNIELGLPIINDSTSAALYPESLGRPNGDVAVGIRQENGDILKWPCPGSGELVVKSLGSFDCYLHPYRTRQSVSVNGWFCTGDEVEVKKNGLIFYKGRKKSVLNVGGLKVFPEEVEEALCQHDAITAARVSGVPHELFGHQIVAEIVVTTNASLGQRAIRKFLLQSLASYKIPLEFIVKKELALTKTGKICRIETAVTEGNFNNNGFDEVVSGN
jgi:long-chain acyl-CoA synthetase